MVELNVACISAIRAKSVLTDGKLSRAAVFAVVVDCDVDGEFGVAVELLLVVVVGAVVVVVVVVVGFVVVVVVVVGVVVVVVVVAGVVAVVVGTVVDKLAQSLTKFK